MTKYVFVTGGVVSGLGKGITAASLGRLLKMRGLKVAAQKLDPYMNIDPGTMSPLQHGEVFVTDDGAETDLDLGHYERFIDENLSKYSNITSGKAYWNVLNKERQGAYLGKTVQIIPHITNETKEFIYQGALHSGADVLITEVGGTTGDIESQAFLEAIRQISFEVGRENCLYIHVTLVPYLSGSNEYKSKPTQHSVKQLQSMGITPDIIVTRSDESVGEDILGKISMFCNVKRDCVVENITVPCLYEAVLALHKNGFDRVVCRELGLTTNEPDIESWANLVGRIKAIKNTVKIAIVGKYVQLHDAYLSIMESLSHAGYAYDVKIDIEWVDSAFLTEENVAQKLAGCKGILVPGGFGDRGIDGKICAARYARENNIPYFGICLGMQIAVIEFARNVCGLTDAHSTEFAPYTTNPVIDFMPDQKGDIPKGGTMRLGCYPCVTVNGTLLSRLYGKEIISERHRHRYEFNNVYRSMLTASGLKISGTSPDERIVETVELPDKKFFVGVQFHPEFKSRPNRAHPLFLGFIGAAVGKDGNI